MIRCEEREKTLAFLYRACAAYTVQQNTCTVWSAGTFQRSLKMHVNDVNSAGGPCMIDDEIEPLTRRSIPMFIGEVVKTIDCLLKINYFYSFLHGWAIDGRLFATDERAIVRHSHLLQPLFRCLQFRIEEYDFPFWTFNRNMINGRMLAMPMCVGFGYIRV